MFRHILADIADLQSTRPRDRAERRLALPPDKETQETGLAAPVGSNETKALALAYDEIEIGKKWLMKGKRKILDRNKRHGNLLNSATHQCPVSKPRYASMCWRMSGSDR
ncbi:hypothetical protein Q644_14535 [Brucella intermedia 229E]|uniref:Uncharacterized protein n=1 Tax=Brucella intermedia 229E TaxID=1337887 RepID=U4VEW4_9HYPH|nr:hypothetical protein Q644_14535 [Brucella intermedia 229E]